MKILIVEDEFNLADAIKSMLLSQKYDVSICTDGEDGLNEAISGIYDLIILDVMLPNVDGFTILKELKNNSVLTKVIMLTAKSSIEDKLNGLNNGADDYLTKPFHMDELLARVNIQLRKNDNNDNEVVFGDIKLNINSLCLNSLDNSYSVNVIGKEFQLLEMFMRNPNQILDKELIFNKIWGYESDCELNTLEVYVSFLRRKLKLVNSSVSIKAIRNMGYRMENKNEKVKD